LYAAGSPHSWPNLLAALAWLVDLLNRYETEAPEEAEELEGDGIWGYLCQGYSCFLKGDDAGIEDLDEQASLQFSQDMAEARREAELIAEKIVEVAGKLEQLQSEPDPLVALETKKPMLLSDCVKFQSYIQNLTSSKLGHQKKIEQHMQQLDSKKVELESLVVENQSLTERIAIQTFKVEDIDKMSREVARVSEDLLSASVSRKQKEKETWDLEVLVSKTLKKLENVALELNHAMKR
jgi:kinetochore protein NDC80